MNYGAIIGGVGCIGVVSLFRDNTRYIPDHIFPEYYIDLPDIIDAQDLQNVPMFRDNIDRYSIKLHGITRVPTTETINNVKYYKLFVTRGDDDSPYKTYLIDPVNGKILHPSTMQTVYDLGPSFATRINSLFDTPKK